MNILENIEQEQIAKLTEGKNIPDFKAGDTLKVHTKVKEGDRERIQVYEGICIARKNDGLNSSFTVLNLSFFAAILHIREKNNISISLKLASLLASSSIL